MVITMLREAVAWLGIRRLGLAGLVVRSERMAVFWVAYLTVVVTVIVMLREAVVAEPLL